jgi:hypothetical protein
MFDKSLIESARHDHGRATWVTGAISVAIHLAAFAAVIGAGYWMSENPEVLERPIEAFIVSSPAPPPPPASVSGSRVEAVEVERTPRDSFVQPEVVPNQLPRPNVEPSVFYNLTVNFRLQ